MSITSFLSALALVLSYACEASAQQYLAAALAGGGAPLTPFPPLNGPVSPSTVSVDAAGNPYFIAGNCVYKLDSSGAVLRVAGSGIMGFAGDGGPATKAQLSSPQGVAVDAAGNVYIADTLNGRIRKVGASGIITTVAGKGDQSRGGDGGPATNAGIGQPGSVAVDAAGNLFFNDLSPLIVGARDTILGTAVSNYAIRKVTASGTISTVAGIGGGVCGDTGDGGPATSANLTKPYGVAADSTGNLFIADVWGNRVRRVAPNGNITTVAGTDTCPGGSSKGAYTGDGGPGTSASLWAPASVAVDSAGGVYIADLGNNRVRKVSAAGAINTVAGSGTAGYSGDGGLAISAQLNQPIQVAVDSAGNLYVAESGRIRKVTPQGTIKTVVIGSGAAYSGDGGLAVNAVSGNPTAMTVDSAGNLYVADRSSHRVRKLKVDGTIDTVAGNGNSGYSGDGGPATSAQLNKPSGVAVDSAGSLYIADSGNNMIRRVATNGTITTVAGSVTKGYSGDGFAAAGGRLSSPGGVAVDSLGNLYIADSGNNVIRLVSNGVITTVAGNGARGFDGDGGPAINASFNGPTGLTLDAAGNLYIIDSVNSRIRKLKTDGSITTASTAASAPVAIASDPAGNLCIADVPVCATLPCVSHLYRVAAADRSTVAIDFHAVSSFGWIPVAVAADRLGNLFVAGEPYLGEASGMAGLQFWGGQNLIWLMTPPQTNQMLSAAVTHSSDFTAAQQDATYQVTVSNARSAGSTRGAVTVTEIVPIGLTVVSMAGTGWSCAAGACTRSDPLAGGASYPAIAVTVSVASTAVPQVVNQVTVSGGGSVASGALDVTNVNLTPPGPAITSVVNAATFQTGGIAPNEYITISGAGLGSAKDGTIGLATSLAGTRVFIGGAQAVLTYAQDRQVNALVPWGLNGPTTTVQVEYNGVSGNPVTVPVAVSSPGIFSQNYGPGQAWVANQDATFNSSTNPSPRNTYVAFWATGQGLVDIPQRDGNQPSGPPFPTPLASVSVSLGSVKIPDANVIFKGLLYTGELQMNILIPDNAPTGPSVPLILTVGNASSRADATIAIK